MAELYKHIDDSPIKTADAPTQAETNILFQPGTK